MKDIQEILKNQPSLEELREREREFKNRKARKKSAKNGKNVVDYFKSISDDPPKSIEDYARSAEKINTKTQRFKKPLAIDDKAAKYILWRLIQNDERQKGFVFKYDEFNKFILADLVKYFCRHPGQYDVNKGIYLWGPKGTGKTLLMKYLRTFVRATLYDDMIFKMVRLKTIEMGCRGTKGVEALEPYKNGVWCFDDVGWGDEKLKTYGNELSLLDEIIGFRYEAYQDTGRLTHCTSNVPPQEIGNLYGSRAADRCNEMFNYVFLGGEKSYRK